MTVTLFLSINGEHHDTTSQNSETGSNQVMRSKFEKTAPIPRGFSGQTYFEFIEETGIAL